ncbi:MAG: nucleotidyltransferase [Parcubacteria group bacterium]
MSITVNDAFNKFNKDYVNLDQDRTKIARDSREWLIKQLVNLPDKYSDFPKLYNEKHINFGSFSRNTKIRELDDIDLILTFSAEHTTYNTIIPGKEYTLHPPEDVKKLTERCNDDGTLNSIKIVNMLVNSLRKVDQYKSSETHRVQEAATLQLNSYEWCYDIVPAFYTDVGFYLIPDGDGGWKATDPRIDHSKVDRINLKHGGKILQIIRTLKFWNRRAMMVTIPSYLFENIILNYFDAQDKLTDFIDLSIRDFLGYLVYGIHYDVQDSKGFQGNLNTLGLNERNNISAKAKDAYSKACEAVQIEIQDKNQDGAIKKWAEVFGPNFN